MKKQFCIYKDCNGKCIKDGIVKARQRFKCKECGRRFLESTVRAQTISASEAIEFYEKYLNNSNGDIKRFCLENGLKPSTLYKHIRKIDPGKYRLKHLLYKSIMDYAKNNTDNITAKGLVLKIVDNAACLCYEFQMRGRKSYCQLYKIYHVRQIKRTLTFSIENFDEPDRGKAHLFNV